MEKKHPTAKDHRVGCLRRLAGFTAVVVLAILVGLLLMSSGAKATNDDGSYKGFRFEVVAKDDSRSRWYPRYTYRERLTDTMFYGYINDGPAEYDYYIPIPDPETGLPLTYTRYKELLEKADY